MVPLRAIREAHGLTSRDVAARMAELGHQVHPDSVLNFENGYPASRAMANAYAHAVGLTAVDVRRAAELRELMDAADASTLTPARESA